VVSSNTIAGDEILPTVTCDLEGQRKSFLPVVRPYDYEFEPTSEIRHSFLIGWAYRVDYTGGVHDNQSKTTDDRLLKLPALNLVTFNPHYEDLGLRIILGNDPTASLTYACKHPKQSFGFV
jgi:hypothetical protein